MLYSETLEGKIWKRIARRKNPILLREDFSDLGGYDQIGRALLALRNKRKIVKIGYGLYAKAKVSGLSGNTVPAEPLPILARKALSRLGIRTAPTKAEADYQAGRSTQVPTGRLIGVRQRINRKISFNDATIRYEINSGQKYN